MIFAGLALMGLLGSHIIGDPAPEWKNAQWINSRPLTLSELRGKVVLVRFFMESACPYCRASAPYLNELYKTYKERGLVVIGMYTPKPAPKKTALDEVTKYVHDYKFQFPVAVDDDWGTLKAFWLDRNPDSNFTSASFLIDREGIIRFIHEGGAYTATDVAKLKKNIEQLLAEARN